LAALVSHETIGSKEAKMSEQIEDDPFDLNSLVQYDDLPNDPFEASDRDPNIPTARWSSRLAEPPPKGTKIVGPAEIARGEPIEPEAQAVLDEFLKHL
jgi:hypothetical protein